MILLKKLSKNAITNDYLLSSINNFMYIFQKNFSSKSKISLKPIDLILISLSNFPVILSVTVKSLPFLAIS